MNWSYFTISDCWFGTLLLFSIFFVGQSTNHWRTHIFQYGYCTTNQIPSGNSWHSYWTWPSRNSECSHLKWWFSHQFVVSLPETNPSFTTSVAPHKGAAGATWKTEEVQWWGQHRDKLMGKSPLFMGKITIFHGKITIFHRKITIFNHFQWENSLLFLMAMLNYQRVVMVSGEWLILMDYPGFVFFCIYA